MRWNWQVLTYAALFVIAASLQVSAQDFDAAAFQKRAEELFKSERYLEAFSVSKEWASGGESRDRERETWLGDSERSGKSRLGRPLCEAAR